VPPHRAATPPRSRPPPSVIPASALVTQHPPGGPHELTGNTLPSASHHRAIGECATVRGLRAVTTPPARPVRVGTWAASPAGPGRKTVAQPAGHPASHGRPPHLTLWHRAGFWPSTVPGVLNVFPFVLINRK
jgi:hypothetical protein